MVATNFLELSFFNSYSSHLFIFCSAFFASFFSTVLTTGIKDRHINGGGRECYL